MPRVHLSKLANPGPKNAPQKRAKSPFFNGKKRLTGADPNSRQTPRVECPELSAPAAIGTDGAIKDKVLGDATIAAAVGRKTRTRGDRKIGANRGAGQSKIDRSRLGRRSTVLRLKEVQNILAAAVFTAQEHRPLNRHTTIHFDACAITDPVTALRNYTKLARDWLATQGATFAYIWVREAGDAKGQHAHLLMHIPADLILAFARRERGWRKRIGAKRARGAFLSTAVGRSYRHGEVKMQYGDHYGDDLRGIVGYLVKGAEPRAVKEFQLSRVELGGELWGKRTGMSENINRTARARALAKVAIK